MLRRADLGGVEVGDGRPVALVGVLNVSPESFYQGSVLRDRETLLRRAEAMVAAGAALLDVGGMSSAPYLSTRVPEAEEARRLAWAIEGLAGKVGVPISADSWRAGPARAALAAGAQVINDVTGLTGDPGMAALVADRGAGLIAMASERRPGRVPGTPIALVLELLEESLALARAAGIPDGRIVVDPGVGFFRSTWPRPEEWDCRVLGDLGSLGALGRPVCVGVSRKSFIGTVTGEADPAGRLPGSLAATALAVRNGAHLIRCHDVAETRQAVRVVEAILGRG